jgi:AraC-like DNA-binding protein
VFWSKGLNRRNSAVETFQNTLLRNLANCHFDLDAEIAKTGYCGSYFRKLFKEYTSQAPLEYLTRLRVEHAKRQLQQYHGIRTIKEIALGSGFHDPYYFSRAFKKHEGVSPQAYIENIGIYSQDQLFTTRVK